MTRPELEVMTALAAIAEAVGFKWHKAPWQTYDSELGHGADTPKDLAHELGHFLVAEPEHKNLPFFGLDRRSKSDDDTESEAAVLGLVMLREAGASLRECRDEACEQNWGQWDSLEMQPVLYRIRRKGLWSKARGRTWRTIHGGLLREIEAAAEADDGDDIDSSPHPFAVKPVIR